MPVDGVQVGSNLREIVCVGDSATSSNVENVMPVTDATNISGKYGGVVMGVEYGVNPVTGNLDRARFATGTTGVHAVSTEGTKSTFSAVALSLTPAASCTDLFTITGNGSTTGRLHRMVITGFCTGGGSSLDLVLVKRSSANSSGTSASVTAAPHDSNDSAAQCTLLSYSANPTLGTAVGSVRGEKINLGAAGAAGKVEWTFTDRNDQAGVIRGTSQVLALNLNGQTIPAGTSITVYAEFVEDNS